MRKSDVLRLNLESKDRVMVCVSCTYKNINTYRKKQEVASLRTNGYIPATCVIPNRLNKSNARKQLMASCVQLTP